MQTKRVKHPKLGPVSRFFVEAVKQIPEVQMVILHYGDEPRIWTIFSSEDFDSEISRKIFTIQIESYSKGDDDIGFRVVNVAQIPGGLSALHIEGMPVLFERQSEAA